MSDNYKFGNYICELREKKGISQSELGKLVGVSNAAVSKWENGKSIPPMKTLKMLSVIFNVPVEDLLNGGPPEPKESAPHNPAPFDPYQPIPPDQYPFQYPGQYSIKIIPPKRKGPVYALMIALFILNFFTLHAGLFLVLASGSDPTFMVSEMWRLYLLLPIPVASIVLGFICKAKGYRTTKNIVAGFIFAALLLIYGSFTLIFYNTNDHDYNYVNQVEAAIALELPDHGKITTINFQSDYDSQSDTTAADILNVSEVTFTDQEEIKAFEEEIAQNDLWLKGADAVFEEFDELVYTFLTDRRDACLLFNTDLLAYDTVPTDPGTYHFYYLAYRQRDASMTIIECEIAVRAPYDQQ